MNRLEQEHSNTSWRALQIYTLYRLAVALFLWTLSAFTTSSFFFPKENMALFNGICLLNISANILFFIVNSKKLINFDRSVELQVFADIIIVASLMYVSGDLGGGLGILMAVSVSAACLLVAKPSSLIFAAIATSTVLSQAIYLKLQGKTGVDSITQAGLLGATYFAIALFALLTAKRLRQSEREAELTVADLQTMEKLNEQIIQYMKTGILVIDETNRIQFINTAAWQLLEMPEHVQGQHLRLVNNELHTLFKLWIKSGKDSASFRPSVTGPKIRITFSHVSDEQSRWLIFLEDMTQTTLQAQNLKLASLGRLTASIAHEIRNPLGALSHAAQLLLESPELHNEDKKLVGMIQKNSIRVNQIIENIMQLSQRKKSVRQSINLANFLGHLAEELQKNQAEKLELTINVAPEDLLISFDPIQLNQVITNLAENGLRYSLIKTGQAQLSLIGRVSFNNNQPYLDIIDKGEGILPEVAEQIFEPFFTTSPTGTGLGLYVAKELCEANSALLDYLPIPNGGSCFRISFVQENAL